ncbi:MAG: hypothetical protein DI598_12990, partial [Pseudopedobacter saltans]
MNLKKYFVLACLTVLFSSKIFAQKTVPNATIVQQQAVTAAQKEDKQVFLIFHASWCAWCHHLDSLLTKTTLAKTFNKHFVLTHVTILENKGPHKKDENPGGMDLFAQYGGSSNTGIPYWVILDKNGKYLANSRMKGADEDLTGVNGDNTGCPGEPQEVEYFINVLEKASHFSPKEIAEVKVVFEK